MRALLCSVGTRGDVEPALALALEIRRLGGDVRLSVPPNFVDRATALGFEARPLGIEMRQPQSGSAPPTPEELRKLGEDLIRDQFDVVGEAADGCDLVVGAGVHQYAVRSVARIRNIPSVVAVYAPVTLPSPELAPVPPPGQRWERGAPDGNLQKWTENLGSWNARALRRVNEQRERLGLPAIDDVLGHILGDRPWLAADPTLGPAPATPGRHVLQTGAWVFADTSPLSPEIEAFLDGGEPPVYLGFGSMPVAKDVSRTLVDAARAAGRRAIVAEGWAELALVDGGSDCLSIGDVNQQALFPRMAAVVHHGGAGTTATAARAGVPQVVVPMFGDQPYWARRVVELGIGTSVAARDLTVEALASAVESAFGAADRARMLAPSLQVDGAVVAARKLLAAADPVVA
jgi:vancomycin aglycone glucosyltransferase